MLRSALALGLIAIPCLAWAEGLEIEIRIKPYWLELPPAGATRSALRFNRAIEAEAVESPAPDIPQGLARSFRLERHDFLLGEPIPVEFRIEVQAGKWTEHIGGNYRARGRDDNFLFVLLDAEGKAVLDPYGDPASLVYMGGLSSSYDVRPGKPRSYWLALQRWAAIAQPGRYELHCFHAHSGFELPRQAPAVRAAVAALPESERARIRVDRHGHPFDRRDDKPVRVRVIHEQGPDSPVLNHVPQSLRVRVERWAFQGLTDYARLDLTIRHGSPAERARMQSDWKKRLARRARHDWPSSRMTAAREAIVFARQDDFLPLLASWGSADHPEVWTGLAMRPSRAAFEILAAKPRWEVFSAMYYLAEGHIPKAIPVCIDALTHSDHQVRAQAEMRLHVWTGQSFFRSWGDGYDWKRPSLAEGRKMQPAWRAWWKANQATFVPRSGR
ncbi:MAG: hypothetical protein JXR96_24225 [Deltaproteobacteria bacterium]|nr:hypothetical protein [Deltaproteobacteria bacterium]